MYNDRLSILQRIADAPREVYKLGLNAGLTMYGSWVLHQTVLRGKARSEYRVGKLYMRGYEHPLHFRHGSSDLHCVRQIFLKGEFEDLAHEADMSFMVDCGANIGCTAFFLLSRYPKARLIAIEPDPGNFDILKKNLEPFGDRAIAMRAGVWSSDCDLRVERGSFGDGKEWSFQVRACREGESADVTAVSLATVMKCQGWDRIDLLKVDIERSEMEVFSSGYEAWLPFTRNIAIELHGADCERVFLSALSTYEYQLHSAGERVMCRNLRPRVSHREPLPA